MGALLLWGERMKGDVTLLPGMLLFTSWNPRVIGRKRTSTHAIEKLLFSLSLSLH